ncbi:DedA family protein [Clostridium puniceum]
MSSTKIQMEIKLHLNQVSLDLIDITRKDMIMQAAIVEIMNEFGYLGIVALIALENIFPPIPSEIILTLGGFMTTYTSMTPIGVIIYATVGSSLGALILYLAGRLLPEERLKLIVRGRIGKLLRFKEEDIEKSVQWFNRKGKYTVLFCRCIPIVRSLISIPAGMTKMNILQFVVYTVAGSLIWNTVLVLLGGHAEASWNMIADSVGVFSSIVALVIGAGIVVGGILFYRKRLKIK